MTPLISIKNLNFSYEKDLVLENISLDIYEKEFLAIIGPNGGGKTTLLKIILGLIKSKDVQKNTYKISYVPQDTNEHKDFPITPLELTLTGLANAKKYFGFCKNDKKRALEKLELVGASVFAHKRLSELSGGMRQRAMIARALIREPKLILLDEPTSSIDAIGQQQIFELLHKLSLDVGITLVSHNTNALFGYAQKIAHINKTLTLHDAQNVKPLDTNSHICEVELLQSFIQTQNSNKMQKR